MRLHNFIIDHGEGRPGEKEADHEYYSAECLKYISTHPEDIVGTFGNGRDGENSRGRPSNLDIALKRGGDALRQRLCDRMAQAGLCRNSSKQHWKKDNCNHIIEC